MARYFFDLDDHEYSKDESGVEFDDMRDARIEAITFAGAYLRDHPALVWDGKELRVIVRQEHNGVVFTVIVLAVDCPGSHERAARGPIAA